jgi:hypothetical protein
METRLVLDLPERQTFAAGHAFGASGDYVRLTGRLCLAVDPDALAQHGIVDLDRAPRSRDGLVECAADVMILAPRDLARGNRRIFFDFGNRANKRALQFFNDAPHTNTPATLADAGNGFLLRRGYAVVWAAWQGDILPGEGRLVLDVPVATDGGQAITGRVRSELQVDRPGIRSLPLSSHVGTRGYPAVSLNPRDATFTRRQYPGDPRISIPPAEWQFARLEKGETGGWSVVPSDSHVYLPAGFEPGWIYELVYLAREPRVLGLGYVVVRDLNSYLKYGESDAAGQPNPLRALGLGMEKAYAWGRSQTGRLLREFLYRGFNADGRGRRVFDGVFDHVAGAGRMWLNHRFAQPIRNGGQQQEEPYNYSDRFPFAYGPCTDRLTGRADALLSRPETDPVLIHTQSSSEYWQRRGSLVHTDTEGRDLTPPDRVRLYLWAGSQHFADPRVETPTRGIAEQPSNVAWTSPLFRALLDHLDRWATDGTPPPPSRIPTRADETLVTVEEWRARFPRIPGVVTPREPNRLPRYDYGPDAERGYITLDPPVPPPDGAEYPVLVPAVDADGNEVAGIRLPHLAAPLGTWTGWNIRARGFCPGVLADLQGSYLPFPWTRAERRATGDPRPAVEERYADAEDYLRAVAGAVKTLVAEGFLLEEDAERFGEGARGWGGARTGPARPATVATGADDRTI